MFLNIKHIKHLYYFKTNVLTPRQEKYFRLIKLILTIYPITTVILGIIVIEIFC